MAEGIFKAAPDDPNRCQFVTIQGQCHNLAVPGGPWCTIHGGVNTARAMEATKIRNYRLTQYQARIEAFADNSAVRSLREEVGILRMIMEEKLNSLKTVNDLLMYSGPITDIAMKIKDIVIACDKLERTTGNMLDKQAVIHFASQVVGIIGNHITDPDILSAISDEILESLRESKDA